VKAAKVVEEQLDAELNKLDNMDEDEMEALVCYTKDTKYTTSATSPTVMSQTTTLPTSFFYPSAHSVKPYFFA
jgi:hypothetical protein